MIGLLYLMAQTRITLYTLEHTKLNVMFETLSHDEGGFASLTVDGDDQIYVSYRKAEGRSRYSHQQVGRRSGRYHVMGIYLRQLLVIMII